MLKRLTNLNIFLILLLAFSVCISGIAEAQNPQDPQDQNPQEPQNRVPETINTFPGVNLTVGGTSATFSLGSYFSDPENQPLTYTATSSDTSIATVSISPTNVLTVTAQAAGTATITVIAIDPGNLSTEQQFSATVTTPNNPPTTVGTIPDQTLTEDGAAVTVDVSSYFNDADGDTLTYTASSSDTAVATVSVSTATVTITPVAAGTATITVTATDPDSETAEQSISVTVNQKNRAPTTVGTIAAQTLKVEGTALTVDVSSYFSDPDGDTLTYTATSSDTTKATVSVSSATVTISAVAVGTATITVTATDPDSETAEQSISVTVNQKNRAPTTVGTIPNQTLKVGGTALTVDVSSYFSDPDGDTLTYTATSSDTTKATVSVSSATVTISAVAVGTATITVTATDPDSETAEQSISVTVNQKNRAPVAKGTIQNYTLPANLTVIGDIGQFFSDPDGDALTYTASSSDTDVATASTSGATLNMDTKNAGTATITVTAIDTSDASLSRSFTLTVSGSSADAVSGLSSEEQLLLGQLLTYSTIIFNELHNGSDDAKDWLELRNVSNVDIPISEWQLRILTGDGNTVIPFPTGTVIPAGQVILITNTEMATADTSVASIVIESFALPQSEFALILRSPNVFGDIAGNYYEGQKERPETAPALTVDTVWDRTQPIVSGYRAEAWAASTYRNGLGSPGYQPSAVTGDLNNDGVVNILDLVLVASQFGITGHTAADLNGDNTVNIQDLVLVANAISNIGAAPTVKQSDAAIVYNWLQLARQNESKIVKTAMPKGFSYERGIEVLEQLARALTPDATVLLANYPNPFNPETWIPYQLAKAADVTVTIYASDGNMVRTLALGHQDAGMYKTRTQAAYWDGKNEMGESVASGIYFYTLTAGDFSATRKMLILK